MIFCGIMTRETITIIFKERRRGGFGVGNKEYLYTSFLRKGQAVETALYAQIRNTVPSLYAVGGQLSLI